MKLSRSSIAVGVSVVLGVALLIYAANQATTYEAPHQPMITQQKIKKRLTKSSPVFAVNSSQNRRPKPPVSPPVAPQKLVSTGANFPVVLSLIVVIGSYFWRIHYLLLSRQSNKSR